MKIARRTWQAINRRSWILVAAITLAGGLLRAYRLGEKGMWLDEAFSVWVAAHPTRELVSWLIRIDQHPPLYYLLLRAWMALGDDPATARSLSAALSTLSIPVVAALGRRLGGWRVGLVAAGLLALSPFQVRFAQETRMYALLTLTASTATLALCHLLTDERAHDERIGSQFLRALRSWRAGVPPTLPLAVETDLAWSAFAICVAATLLTHNAAVLYLVAVNLYVLALAWIGGRYRQSVPFDLRPPSLRNWALAQIGVLILWSPWAGAFVRQAAGVYREFWIPAPTWGRVLDTLAALTNDFLPPQIDWAGAIWAFFVALALLGAIALRRRPAALALLVTLIVAPIAGELLISLRRPIFYDRTLIWVTVPLYLLLAFGICQLCHRSFVLAAVTIVVTINLVSVRQYYLHFRKEEWDLAAAHVARHAQDGDLLLFNATWVQIPFDYYFGRTDRAVEEHGVPVDLFDRGILEPKMTEGDMPRLRELIRGQDRVWLIYSHNWYTDPDGLIPQALDSALDLARRRRFYGLEVHLYVRSP